MSAATATAASATPILNATATAHAATCPSTAEETEAIYAEYSVEPPESDYAEIARVLANGKDERLDLHSEMSMAVSLAKKYGGIGTVCRALGVSEAAAKTVGFVGLSRISISNTRYEPSEDGPLAAIIPIADAPWGEDPEVYDLLAVRLDHPSQFYVRSGYARCLGVWNAHDVAGRTTLWPSPGEVHPSLPLFPDPLSWLRANCQGTCVLNSVWLSYTLVNIRACIAISKHHRKVLQKQLWWAGAPKVFLRRQREAEAA